ncbi:S4 domain-containing protein YaaA [Paenibacillus sp. 1001270B_150601_E10]|uniref:S4 domain-containing protein YaaA n=1 Tax=Paenibacillus sp. 1001270B_150601_E10 TaxID=2787079 RepID=UPI00189CC953|nr:S4 domain-containing protein YaaA [Paenibacillus sp. 1001270B_150601_E10]
MKEVSIKTEYIALGQMLKLADCASSGGHAKILLEEGVVQVNGEVEQRRGRKLYPGDKVQVRDCGSFVIASQEA